MKEGYKLEDTIILNGKVGWVNTGDDADSIIGIQNIQKVKRFSGEEIVVSNDGFAFSKEMESRCGWHDRYASIQMLTGDTPIDMDHIDETKIVSMEGITESEYYHRYSDYTGYLWTGADVDWWSNRWKEELEEDMFLALNEYVESAGLSYDEPN